MLAIEAGSNLCSVALCCETGIHVLSDEQPRAHTQFMLRFVEQLLARQNIAVSELDAIVFSAGPGSFTGIRLAAAVAKSLGYAASVPVLGVSSLAVMAQACYRQTDLEGVYLVVRDAKMGEYYLAEYQCDAKGQLQCLQQERILTANQLAIWTSQADILVCEHDSLHALDSLVPDIKKVQVQAGASDLLQQAWNETLPSAGSALSVQVNYLRDKTGWKNVQQQKQS